MRALLSLLTLLAAHPSLAGEARFETTLRAAPGGLLHPLVAVGFNPQPDPPRWRTDLDQPQSPAVSARHAANTRTDVRLSVAGETGASVETLVLPAGACEAARDVRLYPVRGEVALPPGPCSQGRVTVLATFTDGSTLLVALDLSAEAASWRDVSPGSIIAAPPQPEVDGTATVVLGLRFPVEVTTVNIRLRGADAAGRTVSWR